MKRGAALLLLAGLALAPAAAAAADPVEQARVYYDAGVQAYAAGRYDVAVEAFTQAYKLAAKPSVLFSLAQAERRQFTVDHDSRLLTEAAAHYRKYLEMVPEGGRRADAIEALGELDVLVARLDAGAAAGAAPTPLSARLLVTTATRGATITLDGVAYKDPPVLEQVKPGSHTVRVSAPGCFDEERELQAVEGTVVPYEITLREKPSYLALAAPAGASLTVDGSLIGALPRHDDVELAPGWHVVTVTRTGHVPHVQSLLIERGQTASIEVALKRTTQRWISFVGLGASAATAVAGAALAIGAADRERAAREIADEASQHNISQASLDNYNGALAQRDTLAVASAGTFGAAAALALASTGLYLFDNPTPPTPDAPRQSRKLTVSLAVTPAGSALLLGGSF